MTSPIRIGVIGLGRAFSLMLAAFRNDSRVSIVGGCDPRPEARAQFLADFAVPAFTDASALCALDAVELVYIASPHQFHAEHAVLAARHGKHALVEKPIALSLAESNAMIAAHCAAGTKLLVGPSHSFDAPITQLRKCIADGVIGEVRMVTAANFTDFVYRPRRPEELQRAHGGGAVLNQAAHHVDIVRAVVGLEVTHVSASIGAWDSARAVDGAYSAHLRFQGGAFANLSYCGYGHFDSAAVMGAIDEMGYKKSPQQYGISRKRLRETPDEQALKSTRNYGGSVAKSPPNGQALAHAHFGHIVVSGTRGDAVPTPRGVDLYLDDEVIHQPLHAPPFARHDVIDALWSALREYRPSIHSSVSARETLRVCLAIIESAEQCREIELPLVHTR